MGEEKNKKYALFSAPVLSSYLITFFLSLSLSLSLLEMRWMDRCLDIAFLARKFFSFIEGIRHRMSCCWYMCVCM